MNCKSIFVVGQRKGLIARAAGTLDFLIIVASVKIREKIMNRTRKGCNVTPTTTRKMMKMTATILIFLLAASE